MVVRALPNILTFEELDVDRYGAPGRPVLCCWRQTITLGEVSRKQSFSNGFFYKRERFFGFSCFRLSCLSFKL